MSSRFVSVVGFVVLSITSVACYVQPENGQESGSKSGAFGGSKTGSNGATNEEGGAGTCDSACGNYLTCKGIDSTQNRATCVKNCKGMNVSEADLTSLAEADCATAIKMVEGEPKPASGGSSGGSAKGSECDGCVRDGNECIWLSQSNWGPGAYSGAASSCNASCCE